MRPYSSCRPALPARQLVDSEPATSGRRLSVTANIKRWQSYRNAAGRRLGYIDAQLPSGMITIGNKLMRGPNGTLWIPPPSVQLRHKDGSPRLEPNGKPLWYEVIQFDGEVARKKYQDLLIEALRLDFPSALDGIGP